MKISVPIQLKAAFLIAVFSLNMLVGFACALGVDMDFNKRHHTEESGEIHIHKDGKKHLHKKAGHDHKENKSKHKHEEKKDDCCSDEVIKISQEVKNVPSIAKLVSPVFVIALTAVFYNINIFYPSQTSSFHKYFVRGHHPPIPDIRIAIQSFQI